LQRELIEAKNDKDSSHFRLKFEPVLFARDITVSIHGISRQLVKKRETMT
jgi:hypothetical protein